LEAALRSLQRQTYLGFQLIIVDDGSEDESFEIASELTKDFDDQVEAIFLSPGKVGLAKALDLGSLPM